MLDMNSSRIFDSEMGKLASDVPSVEEGTAMVRVLENGSAVVRPSAGTATERFAGIAQSQVVNGTVAPTVEEITVPVGGGVVTLIGNPVGDVAVRAGDTAFEKDTTAAAGKFAQNGRSITFASADQNKKVTVVYRRTLSVLEAQALYGQGILDGAQSIIEATGLITKAPEVFISNYDPTSNWWDENAGPVYTGPGGVVTLTDTGSLIERADVIQAPTPTHPFLGLRLNV